MAFNEDTTQNKNTLQIYQDYKKYSAGSGCRGICDSSELVISPKRHKGYTCQAEGIKYCKRCAKHFKPETGLRCPCCNQRLKGRIRSKQSKQYRENQRIIREYENSIGGKYFWYSCGGCDFDTASHIQSFFHKKETGHQRTIKEVDILFVEDLVKRLAKETNQEETYIQNIELSDRS